MKLIIYISLLGLLIACGGNEQTETPVPDDTVASVNEAITAVKPATDDSQSLIDKSDPNWKSQVTAPEMMTFEANKTYIWQLETTQGTMTFELFHEASPEHVNSTIYLTNLGFYDDTLFHRVIPGFMAQGGDPTGTGRGGPAYKYDGEFAAGLSHTTPGLLSMANAGAGTDGSQFFITFVPTPFLDRKHTIFFFLLSGIETLQALEARGSRSGQTSEILKILKATVIVQ